MPAEASGFGLRPVRSVRLSQGGQVDPDRWPATVPAVAQVLREGLELPAGLTLLVGENGSGKSTLVEILAEACGLNPQGGSAHGQLFRTRDSEPHLGEHLTVERSPGGRTAWSYFLRADTMHSLYSYLEDNPGLRPERWHELSHGEGFLQVLRTRVNQPGFYLMDEPDAPLSFTACLGLAALLHDLAGAGGAGGRRHPLAAAGRGARREDPGTRDLGHPPGALGRPGPGHRLAPVPGRAAGLFPAPAGRVTASCRVPLPTMGRC